MLNLFPTLLNAHYAPLLLRVVVGLIFIDLGILKFKSERERWMASFDALGLRPTDLFVSLYGALQIIGGAMFILGLWTQGAALFFALSTGTELYVEWKAREILKRDMVFYLLIFIISLSLLLSGAGQFAIDIPL